MPVLEATDNNTVPRSALRYRPIAADAAQTGKGSIVTAATTPVVQRASRTKPHPRPVEVDDDVAEWQRADAGAKSDGSSQGSPPPPTRRTTNAKTLPKRPQPGILASKHHIHPLLYLGVGMLAMLALWTVLTMVVSWAQTTLDDIHYGRPRTFQIDAVVGHNDSASNPSHFIAINLNHRIQIIEMPGGDSSHARIYQGPQLFGPGSDLAPVTLSFADLNGDHKPDMIIHFQGSQMVLINDQGGFRPPRPDERHQVEQSLQRLGGQ